MDLSGKVALVTGGNRGIGAGCSLALAKGGADVAFTYRRDEDSAKGTAAAIEALGRKAMFVQADVSNEEEAKGAVASVIDKLGKVDFLIANAGVASRGNTVRDTPTEEFRRLVDTHAFGAIWVSQAVIDSMREQGDGRIVFISSTATKNHSARSAPYTVAKVAMEAVAKALALEEGPNGIRTNIVGPGLVETEMGRRLTKAHGGDIDKMHATHPFGRVCQPEDIANVVAFLCSDKGSYVNGQLIYVDGGGF
ncbi:MAG: SDR family oxidoreductase, partial [Candidatus Hydrogenedentes bacterium]|nr:SDR family oxidoreductase [Candidatus Hydrogenedentota bacterium]